MKFSNHLIILSTIIFGFWIDDFLNPITIKLYLELNFGFLIFAYWVFAMPEKLHSSAALFYGLVTDLLFSNVIGFNMLFFIATSYIIHLYVFRFRIFSYFQLSVFFSGSSTFYIACQQLWLNKTLVNPSMFRIHRSQKGPFNTFSKNIFQKGFL